MKRLGRFLLLLTRLVAWLLGLGGAALFVVFVWLTATESGSQWLVHQLDQRLPALSVGQVQGNLWQGLQLHDLDWHGANGLQLQARQAALALGWAPFWQFRLDLQQLSLQHARLVLPAGQARPAGGGGLALNLHLPVAVQVEQLALDDMQIVRSGPSATPVLRIPHLIASARTQGTQLRLRLVAARLQVPSAGGGGSAVDLDGHGQVALGLTGRNKVAGRLAVLGSVPPGWFDGAAILSGRLAQIQARLQASWIGADGLQAGLDARGTVTAEQVQLQHFALDTLGGVLCGQGRVDWSAGLAARLSGRAHGLDPSVLAGPTGRLGFHWQADYAPSSDKGSARATLKLTGLNGQVDRLPISDMTVHGQWQGDRLTLAIPQGRLLGAQVQGQGHLGLDATRDVQAEVKLDGLDLARLAGALPATGAPKVAGHLSLKARLQGQLGGSPAVRFAVTPVDGSLHVADQPAQSVSGQVQGHWRDGGLSLTDSRLRIGAAHLSVAGKAGQTLDLSLGLDLPDLAKLPWALLKAPPMTGQARFQARLRGSPTQPVGQLEGKASRLGIAGLQLQNVTLSAKLAGNGRSHSATAGSAGWRTLPLHVTLQTGAVHQQAGGRLLWQQLRLTSDGQVRQQHSQLTVVAPAGHLTLALVGGWQALKGGKSGWQGRLQQLQLTDTALGSWHLRQPAALTVAPDRQQLEHACLVHHDSQFCLQARHGSQGLKLQGKGRLALKLAEIWLPDGVRLPGRADLSFDVEGPADQPIAMAQLQGQAQVQLSDSRVELSGGKQQTLDYQNVRLKARLQNQQLQLTYGGRIDQVARIEGQGQIGLVGKKALSLDSRVQIDKLAKLDPLVSRFTDAIDALQGQLQARVRIGGALGAPKASGDLTVSRLGFSVPETGVAYRDGQLNARIDSGAQLSFNGNIIGERSADQPASDGSAKPGGTAKDKGAKSEASKHAGTLKVSGQGDLAGLLRSPRTWRVQARIRGDGVPLLDIPVLKLDASPDLTLDARASGAKVTGTLLIPYAAARIEKLPESAVKPTSDVVVVGQQQVQRKPAYPVHADIKLKLGDQVSLAGMGFSSKLKGSLNLKLQGDDPQSGGLAGFGEINLVDGAYTAYGQTLQVKQGRLIFSGPLRNPGLAVTASRKVDQTEVGLRITGTLQDPRTKVFSSPSMPESDALALLLTGHKLNNTTQSDSSLLLNAVTGLGLSQSDQITQDIGQRFGLDEVGLSSSGGLSGTRLTLGKRIGDRLFVRYAIGVLNGVGELISRYKINKFLDIQVTASPESQGGDLIYRIEEGRPKKDANQQ